MLARLDLKLHGTVLALVALLLLLAVTADAALVRVGRVVVRADGGYAPTTLPRNDYVPIRFHGWADISSTDSAPPPALRSVVLDFDRAGRLMTRGLPVCRPSQIEGTTPPVARRRCKNALVGKGTVAALVTLPGAPVTVRSPLSIFNGPRVNGKPTVLGHAQATLPKRETYVVVVPIERRKGTFGYRATIEIPEIQGGLGILSHLEAQIGKSYRSKDSRRSYVSARCADGVFETRGRFTFADATVIEGSVYKACTARG
jgi:hypothetical protein